VEVNKAFTSQCIDQYGRGELSTTNASIAKLMTTELQGKVADQCLQLFGGYGYMKEYPISRDYVDARIQRIYGVTSEIMKEIIARDILVRYAWPRLLTIPHVTPVTSISHRAAGLPPRWRLRDSRSPAPAVADPLGVPRCPGGGRPLWWPPPGSWSSPLPLSA